MNRLGEFEWISKYLAPLAGRGAFDLTDDAALLPVNPDKYLVITQDAICENIHFFDTETPDVVARKALRVNISDLIAKGATPTCYSLALGVPDRWTESAMALFASGLERDQSEFGLQLTGGDTYRSPAHLSVSVTMIGEVDAGKYVSRLNAQPGDAVCTTGSIGDAAIGLWIMSGGLPDVPQVDAQWLIERHKIPRPPFGFQSLVSRYATASMDVSDGLLGDLEKLCKASGASARIERSNVPVSLAVRQILDGMEDRPEMRKKVWERVLGGGDDYQSLFTVPDKDLDACLSEARQAGFFVTKIGEMVEDDEVKVSLTNGGMPMSAEVLSYNHF